MVMRRAALLSLVALLFGLPAWANDNTAPEGFVSLFNGKDLRGWKVPAGDNGHWKVVDGVIDYDAQSEAAGDKSLWSDREYGDFILQVDWRLKEAPFLNKNVPYILPDGTHARDVHGKELRLTQAGLERLQEAREGWKQAQSQFAAAFGEERAAGLRALLREVSATELPAESAATA